MSFRYFVISLFRHFAISCFKHAPVLLAYRPWICLPVPFKEVRLRPCHYSLLYSTIKQYWTSTERQSWIVLREKSREEHLKLSAILNDTHHALLTLLVLILLHVFIQTRLEGIRRAPVRRLEFAIRTGVRRFH